jgi:hypothetical protein
MTVAASTRIRPRPVFCVVAREHEDLELAVAVADGTFTQLGVTVEAGLDPDWLNSELPLDNEWRIDWWKFGYGLDLAYAREQTDDPRFQAAWCELVDSFLRRVPVGRDDTEVAARRVQNWIYAWTRFDHLPTQLERRLLDRIAAETAYVRSNLTPERNHRTLELYGLFLAALALPRLDPGGVSLTFAIEELHRNLLTDFREDGVHCESSTHYHLLALRSLLGARENARRFGLRLPSGFDRPLERACEFALHCHRPDGVIPAVSDSDSGSYLDLLELAGNLFDRDDLRWVASGGARGTPPSRRCASFAAGGYYVQRSGWGEGGQAFADERFLIFDCGPLGDGGHGHYDLLCVEIAAGGRPLVVDPGRYTYSEAAPNFRRWFKGTAAHNTICVDGLDQTPYRRGKPKGPVATGRLLGRRTGGRLDTLLGEAVSPVYDAIHRRRIVFVDGEYWVIEDRVEAPTPHRFDLRFHLTAAAQGRTTIDDAVVRAPGFAIVVADPHRPSLEAGWVAPRYGRKEAAPVVSVAVDGCREARFVTLVVPLADGEPCPTFTVSAFTPVTKVGVGRDGGRDWISWSSQSVDVEIGVGLE